MFPASPNMRKNPARRLVRHAGEAPQRFSWHIAVQLVASPGMAPVKGACNAIRQHSSQQHKFNVMWFDAQVGIRGGRVEY